MLYPDTLLSFRWAMSAQMRRFLNTRRVSLETRSETWLLSGDFAGSKEQKRSCCKVTKSQVWRSRAWFLLWFLGAHHPSSCSLLKSRRFRKDKAMYMCWWSKDSWRQRESRFPPFQRLKGIHSLILFISSRNNPKRTGEWVCVSFGN